MNYQIHVKIKSGQQVLFKKSFASLPIVFGRGLQCHLSTPSFTSLSRTHGSINVKDNRVIVTDLNSKNGIFVGNERVMNLEVPIISKSNPTLLNFSVPTNGTAKDNNRLYFEFTVEEEEIEITALANTIPMEMPMPGLHRKVTNQPASGPASGAEIVSKMIRIEEDVNLDQLKGNEVGLQGVITWGDEIFDVRQFRPGDDLTVGFSKSEVMSIPSLAKRMKFGVFGRERGQFYIPKTMKWRLSHRNGSYSIEEAIQKKIIEERSSGYKFKLGLMDICSIDLGVDIALHFRYVEIPRPLVPRSWLENREEFRKAITTSAILHVIVCALALASAPPVQAPVVENLPPRYAKLLVEPPPQILAAPPAPVPPPLEAPKPEEPIAEIPKPVEPPKPQVVFEPPPPPPKPKPIFKKVVVKKAPDTPKEPPREAVDKPVVANVEQPKPTVAKPVGPSPEETAKKVSDEMANSFANAFSSVPKEGPAAGAKTNIKIDNSSGTSTAGFKTAGLVGSLKTQVSKGAGLGGVGGNPNNLAKAAGEQGYAKGSGNAGKRQIGGGVVGIPKFENPASPQGLKNDEIMKVVNKHLNDIQRCYERALFQDSNIAGRVEYEWIISESGKVTQTSVKRSEVSGGEFLNTCVLAIFKKMQFPAAVNKQQTTANIGFPFGKN